MRHQLPLCAVQDLQVFEVGAGVCPYIWSDHHGAYDVVFGHVGISVATGCKVRRSGMVCNGCALKAVGGIHGNICHFFPAVTGQENGRLRWSNLGKRVTVNRCQWDVLVRQTYEEKAVCTL